MQAFQKNSNIFNLLSEGVSEGILVVNEKQQIVATNSSAERMFGYQKEEIEGQFLDLLIPSRYQPVHKKYVDGFIAKSEKRPMGHDRPLWGVRKNGEEFPLEAGLNPFNLYGTTYVMALVIDISERKSIEKELTIKSEALKSSINGITITDALQEERPVIYANAAFERLTGYSNEEIVGHNLRFLQGDDRNQPGVLEMQKAINEGRSCQVEIRNYRKDGTLFWNEISITPIKDEQGTTTHFIGIQDDITRRKKIEEERIYWAKIFNEAQNEIFVFDANTLRFINVNQGALGNMGYTLEEFKNLTPVDIKPEFNEAQFRAVLEPLVQKNEEKIEFETVHLRKDGSTYPVEVHLQMSALEENEVFLAIILDITERKNYTEKLERTVEERTKQLTEALAAERELNELKTRFLSLVSHEFKTPLSSILTSTTLLGKYTEAEQQNKREKHIDTIQNKVRYLDTILNDFLSLERLETGKVNYNIDTFPLSKVVNEVVYDANMLLKAGQKIQYPKDIDDLQIVFEEKILELALSNLVHNAIKYSPEHTTIEIKVVQIEDTLVLKIIDEGVGIPEEDQKYIFNRYFRAKNALLNQGTGIGLNIAKQHLENLGASLNFKSTENKGSTFTIRIPMETEKTMDR
ncbi:PAS domain S-box protein [Flavobacteriaceae bacterium TP-CH-4]|uniref:histidine kinase n=1 Tax=Pelagihabitans pacificus TaxID=2696054 RepID=A0A967ASS7_9FLAO|nr:PAS domain-containing sensor histidine kinase [Pelagihabitans pacificus]NHF59714.1 PAS domain S-box protein [Pelagihabitans pacificus]